ncbi:hypothetical protein MAPG_01101 [Magnaporthiopsis poae ATCC 64411]|uniref:Azaphilone pigments biosynthesis cluster protein L N-terminal domain-containing protein n=1 Tax=Magnaporthiopsis poae (strain ATCC 64411 / 73-15) TaxID=644358 RepID=A0A0C4DMT8_MAGP6|nr:hypothetical protein MAPG_01101 [Magnaporthiopsis poae ATCC 64411]
MADPLSIGASVLAIVTGAIQATNSLRATVSRYKARDKTLNRLYGELEGLATVLSSLEQAAGSEASIWALLEGPVSQCSKTCREFEGVMEKFGGKSVTGLRDWAKMEFMRDDINGFIDTLAAYKATITVGLGVINMLYFRLSHQVLESFDELIKDTVYNLEMRLQRIDENLARINPDETSGVETSIKLHDEKDVTRQCLHLCEKARSYLESLQGQQTPLQEGAASNTANIVRDRFEAELLTGQAIDKSRDIFAATIRHIQEGLNRAVSSNGPQRDQERLRLQEDIDMSKQCLALCKEASNQVAFQKIHIVREVVAEDDTDQVVVTTLADLFDVGKVSAKNRSAQLVGSMTDDALKKLSSDRYSSRFGVVPGNPGQGHSTDPPSNRKAQGESKPILHPIRKDRRPASADSGHDRPSSNEVRKRVAEGGGGA